MNVRSLWMSFGAILLLQCSYPLVSAFIPSAFGRSHTNERADISTTAPLWDSEVDDAFIGASESAIPVELATPALLQLYPKLLEHKQQYGNPNIPLGTTTGRQCAAIRRMQVQQKLTDIEVQFLENMGFIFHSLEDIYDHVDFEDIVPRLQQYKDEFGDLAVPKKYAPDPELGAWVTGVRRLGKDRVDSGHVKWLDGMDFIWVSTRKCGSKFMSEYRTIQIRVQNQGIERVLADDPAVLKFIRAQKEAYKRDTLSETRKEYMTSMLGDKWWEKEFAA